MGQQIGHYQILSRLGEGGMGIVYKARDTHLDRFVAIKVLPPELVADPDRKRRFVQEAKAASALNHPNIITIHDITNENGTDFIVMEYVDGKTLSQAIPRRGLKLNEVLKYGIQIADALAKAHAAGIIHRDLKPANIMVGAGGLVKVVDFGLAKLTERPPVGDDESTVTVPPQTREGMIVGTASYMSPEQAAGRPVDARSDIFSFGSVLYEMVTGQRAFPGDSRTPALAAVLNQEPKPGLCSMDMPGAALTSMSWTLREAGCANLRITRLSIRTRTGRLMGSGSTFNLTEEAPSVGKCLLEEVTPFRSERSAVVRLNRPTASFATTVRDGRTLMASGGFRPAAGLKPASSILCIRPAAGSSCTMGFITSRSRTKKAFRTFDSKTLQTARIVLLWRFKAGSIGVSRFPQIAGPSCTRC